MYYPVRGQTINKSHDLCKGLLGIWPTNNGTGEILTDASGNNNTGVKYSTVNFPVWQAGIKQHGSQLAFNGAERIAADKPRTLTANCSLLVWASRDSGSSTYYPCPLNHRSSGSTSTLIGVYLVWSGAIHWWCGGSGGNTTGTGKYQEDTLHCFAVTHDSSGVGKFYVDGQLIQTVTGKTWGSVGTPVQWWGYYVGGGLNPLDGSVGLSALWDKRTLSAEDVKLLYREPFCMFEQLSPANVFYVETGDWLGIDSTNYYDHCGDTSGYTVEEALDGTDGWAHFVNETHYLVLDLGQTYNVTKVRGRSNNGEGDPANVNIYVSDNPGNFGTAVASNITTWHDISSWVEIECTPKEGRYVKIEITDTQDTDNFLAFLVYVDPDLYPILDVYGAEVAGPTGTTLHEYYNTGDDGYGSFYGNYLLGQTFTVGTIGSNENFNVTSVKVKAFRIGSPGTVYAYIYAVDGEGKPTGSALSTGSLNANLWTTNTAGAWYEFTMSTYELQASTQYALVLSAPSGNVSNIPSVLADFTSPIYTGGVALDSNDGGSTWTKSNTIDMMFEIWGEDVSGQGAGMYHHLQQLGVY